MGMSGRALRNAVRALVVAGCAAGGLTATQMAGAAATQTPPGTYAYVADWGGNAVTAINTATNSVTATIGVGSHPLAVAVSSDGKRVYVTNTFSNNVSVIDATTDTVAATVPVGTDPQAVALTPDGTRAFVANNGGGTVSVLSTATNTVTATIGVGSNPEGIAISPDGTRAYVSNSGGGSVSVINTGTDTVTNTVSVGAIPLGVVVDGTHVWVADAGDGTVSVIDTSNNSVTKIPAGSSPYGIAAASDGSTIYITDRAANVMKTIATGTQTITGSVATGTTPQQIALTPDGAHAYIPDFGSNDVSVINVATQSAGTPIAVGSSPIGVAIGTIQQAPTTLTAGNGHLSLLPLGVTGLNATLTSNGTPVAGQTIAFTADDGTPLCQAVTDANGHASCNAVPPILTTVGVLLGGYQASFAGNIYLKSSSAHGSLELLLFAAFEAPWSLLTGPGPDYQGPSGLTNPATWCWDALLGTWIHPG